MHRCTYQLVTSRLSSSAQRQVLQHDDHRNVAAAPDGGTDGAVHVSAADPGRGLVPLGRRVRLSRRVGIASLFVGPVRGNYLDPGPNGNVRPDAPRRPLQDEPAAGRRTEPRPPASNWHQTGLRGHRWPVMMIWLGPTTRHARPLAGEGRAVGPPDERRGDARATRQWVTSDPAPSRGLHHAAPRGRSAAIRAKAVVGALWRVRPLVVDSECRLGTLYRRASGRARLELTPAQLERAHRRWGSTCACVCLVRSRSTRSAESRDSGSSCGPRSDKRRSRTGRGGRSNRRREHVGRASLRGRVIPTTTVHDSARSRSARWTRSGRCRRNR